MMKRKSRDEWCAALRSGDYAQGKELLCRVDANGEAYYCCLGVAAELELGENAWRTSIYDHGHLTVEGSDCIYSPWGAPDETTLRLMGMNDDGKTFAEIADWIEQNVEVES